MPVKSKKMNEADVSAPPFKLPDNFGMELREVASLRRNPNNSRVHTPTQARMIAASIKQFGWTFPILVDEADKIEAGHGRLDGAEQIYKEDAEAKIKMASGGEIPHGTVPVIVARGWSEEQKRAYLEADNRLSEIAGFDQDARKRELDWLKESGFPLDATGWNDAGLNPAAEWGGMPEFEQPADKGFKAIVVHFHDQAGVDAFEKLVGQKITDKTKFLWFPEMKIKPFLKYE